MTLREHMRQAVTTNDATKAGRIAEFMRVRLGASYRATFEAFERAAPGLTLAEFDALLYEADEAGKP